MDNYFNFAIGTLSGTYDASTTTFTLISGDGSKFPAAPFNAVVWNATAYTNPADDPNREIIRVTAKAGDTFSSALRGQETTAGGIAASTKNTPGATYKIMACVTQKLIADLMALAVDVGVATIWVTQPGYGAKGDGVTDDFTPITNAITDGNLIIFPVGTFIVGAALALKSNLTLRGAGVGLTIIKLKGSAGAERVLKDPGSSVSRVRIEAMTIDGNEANNATALDGIDLANGCDMVAVDGVEVRNCRRKGMSFGQAAGTCRRLNIHGCFVSSTRDHGIEVQNRGNDNIGINISDVTIETPGASGGTAKAGIVASGRVQVSNVSIYGVAGNNYGVFLRDDGDSSAGNGAHDSHFSNVHVFGSTHASNVTEGFRINADRCTFQGCFVDSCDLCFRSGTSSSTGDDNTFIGCSSNGGDEGFHIEGDRNVIESCKIAGTPALGINYAATADEGIFRNNNITGTTKVTVTGTNLHARNNVGWRTHAVLESANIDVTGNGEKQQVVAWGGTPGVDVQPPLKSIWLNHYRSTGTGVFGTRGPYVESVDGTNVTCSYNVTALVAATNAKLVIFIDIYP